MNSIQGYFRGCSQWPQQLFGLDNTASRGTNQSQRDGRLNLNLAIIIPEGTGSGVEIDRHRKSWSPKDYEVFTSENHLGRRASGNSQDHSFASRLSGSNWKAIAAYPTTADSSPVTSPLVL